MKERTLGDMPENLAAMARFRPADKLDFGRRAKSLAKLTDCPLQAAQQILARAYGYDHLHELQEVLKTNGDPGPFGDRLGGMTGLGYEGPAKLRYYRDSRLMRCFGDWLLDQKTVGFDNRYALICDLGLFLSPAAHRERVKAVDSYLETGKGVSHDGFPFGYNGQLHWQLRCPINVEDQEFDSFAASADLEEQQFFDPRYQFDLLRRYRAPRLFLAMLEDAAPEMLEQTHEVEYYDDRPGEEVEELLQSNFDFDIGHFLFEAVVARDGHMEANESIPEMEGVLREPTDERIAHCPATRVYEDFRESLSRWRLSLRIQVAQAIVSGEYHGYDGMDDEPVIFISTRQRYELCMLMQPQYNELEVEHWTVSATLFARDDEGGLSKPAAILSGHYLIPYKDRAYQVLHEVQDEFGYDDHVFDRALTLLERQYLVLAGYAGYKDWVGDYENNSLALVTPWVAPGYRGTDASHALFQCLADVFEEGCGESWDARWKGWLSPRVDVNSDEIWEQVTDRYSPLGVVFVPFPKSGIFAYSIWADDPEQAVGQVLRENGVSVRSRRDRRAYRQDIAHTGLAWRMIDTVKKVNADFIFFDPEEPFEQN